MKTLIQAFLMKIERITELKHKNLLANSIFLVGKLMKLFQILNIYSIQYFLKERQHKDFKMKTEKFHISCEKTCDHILICETDTFLFPVKVFASRFSQLYRALLVGHN